MRFLITGLAGFAAGHLADLLLGDGHEVFGLVRDKTARARKDLRRRLPALADEVVVAGDVCERAVVEAAIARARPDGIFHLAAQSSVAAGEGDAASTFLVNTVGTLQVLQAVRQAGCRCRVLFVSSGECYGRAAGDAPVDEDVPLRPASLYAVSKAAAELLVRQAVESHDADVVRVRAFNHTGPGQSPRFVCADFARQVVEVERGEQPVLRVGNLEAVRDFLDVRDVVRAYLRAWEQGDRGAVYNVASGVGRRIGQVLVDLCRRAGVDPRIEREAERMRTADVPVLIGDSARLRRLGWAPEKPWGETLDDLLADGRRRASPPDPPLS